MKTEYKRDMNHNYMILEREELDTASYQIRILVGNMVPSLLKCRVQSLDGKFMIYYDVTSRQSLSVLYEKKKFQAEDLQGLFGGIIRVLEEMSEYLLDPGQLLMSPEYIYGDIEKKELQFCYLPGHNQEIPGQLRTLTEYLLPRLDHEDKQAVMLGYGIYRRTMEDTFHLEHIKEELYRAEEPEDTRMEPQALAFFAAQAENEKQGKETLGKAEPSEESCGERAELCGTDTAYHGAGKKISWKREEERPEKMPLWKKITGCAMGSLLCLGIASAGFLGYLPWLETEILLGAVIAGMGLGTAVGFVWKRKKQASVSGRTGNAEAEIPSGEPVGSGNGTMVEASAASGKRTPAGAPEAAGTQAFFGKSAAGEKAFGETVVLSASPVCGPATLVSREPGELATIYLQEEITVIGKLETAADAVIPLATVSRLHAKIRRRDGEYYLTDLNSRNGTSVNGRLLKGDEEYCLQEEDQVDFAQAQYVFLK